VAAAIYRIRGLIESHRTPAGLGRFTDDDIFRIVFAGVGAAAMVALVVLWPGLSSWIGNGLTDMFAVLETKFEWLGTGRPLDAMRPTLVLINDGAITNYGPTGLSMTATFFPLFVGVTLYTAAFIAEIVRGGILAVDRGQTEAAEAVGLNRAQTLRRVVLPQAFRIILPPLGNQYLNLAKNTSLGIAVAFGELVTVGQTIYNQTGRTIQVIILWMIFYLTVSLILSAIVNYFNVRLKLVER
jgi:general L-amino acid transport system permease protein